MRCLGSIILHFCWWLADCFTCLWSAVWVEGHPNHCGPTVSVITPQSYLSCVCMQKACFWWTVKRKMNCCNENIPSPRSSLETFNWFDLVPSHGGWQWFLQMAGSFPGHLGAMELDSPSVLTLQLCRLQLGKASTPWVDIPEVAGWNPQRCSRMAIYTWGITPRLVLLMAHTCTG